MIVRQELKALLGTDQILIEGMVIYITRDLIEEIESDFSVAERVFLQLMNASDSEGLRESVCRQYIHDVLHSQSDTSVRQDQEDYRDQEDNDSESESPIRMKRKQIDELIGDIIAEAKRTCLKT